MPAMALYRMHGLRSQTLPTVKVDVSDGQTVGCVKLMAAAWLWLATYGIMTRTPNPHGHL